ncbi:helix-turn-helix domain-containing protein [Mesorhizobium sp. Root157]|uniref:helix-turn-helix domain-containing protein n=1 Tax=Mesorhizobium sp. Root157 TaxID=1736477 RepID=UPI000AAFC5E9|nr:helix-turn-helix transcriptional regulator [Mesorhizobium sp. Root157]
MNAPDTIGGRAAGLRSELRETQQGMADRLGISLRAWQKIERDEGVPSGETLLLFKAVDVNPGWVLTGLGPRMIGQQEREAASVDPDLLEKLARLAKSVHQEMGMTLPGDRATNEAGNLYNDLVAKVSDLSDKEMIEATLPQLRLALMRRLKAAAAAPGTGKRSAS